MILDLESQILTQISRMDLTSGFGYLLVISLLPNLHINCSTMRVEPSAKTMCVSSFDQQWVLHLHFQWSLLIGRKPYSQLPTKRLFHSYWNGSFLMRWCVVDIRAPWHLKIRRVILRISNLPIMKYIGALVTVWTYANQPLFLPHFLGLGKSDMAYVLIGAGYCPFGIWQNNSVSGHPIFGPNEA